MDRDELLELYEARGGEEDFLREGSVREGARAERGPASPGSAKRSLSEIDRAVERYEARVAAAPTEVRERRFLASAYVAARRFVEATAVVAAGLALAPDDPTLIRVPRRRGGRNGGS